MDPTKFRNLRVSTVFVAATSTCSRSAAHGRHQRVPLRRPAAVFQHPLESRGLLLGRGGALHRPDPLTQLALFSTVSFCVNVLVYKGFRLWTVNFGEEFMRSVFLKPFLFWVVFCRSPVSLSSCSPSDP